MLGNDHFEGLLTLSCSNPSSDCLAQNRRHVCHWLSTPCMIWPLPCSRLIFLLFRPYSVTSQGLCSSQTQGKFRVASFGLVVLLPECFAPRLPWLRHIFAQLSPQENWTDLFKAGTPQRMWWCLPVISASQGSWGRRITWTHESHTLVNNISRNK